MNRMSKAERDKLTRKLKRQGLLLTTDQFFRRESRRYIDLILRNCRDRWATRENLRELLALTCLCSVGAKKPLVKFRNPNSPSTWIPSDDPDAILALAE